MTNKSDQWDPLISPYYDALVRKSIDSRAIQRLQAGPLGGSISIDFLDEGGQQDANTNKADAESGVGDNGKTHRNEDDADMSDTSDYSHEDNIDSERVEKKKEKYRQLMSATKAGPKNRQAQLKRSQSSRGCYEDKKQRNLGSSEKQLDVEPSPLMAIIVDEKEKDLGPAKKIEPEDRQAQLKRSQSSRGCYEDTPRKQRDLGSAKSFEPKNRRVSLTRSQSSRACYKEDSFSKFKEELLQQDNLAVEGDTGSSEKQLDVEASSSMTQDKDEKESDLGPASSPDTKSRRTQLQRSQSSRGCHKEEESSKSKALVSSLAALSGKTDTKDPGRRALLRRAVSDLGQKIRADLLDPSSPGDNSPPLPKSGSPSSPLSERKQKIKRTLSGLAGSEHAFRIPRRNMAKIQLPNPDVASRLAGTRLGVVAAAAGVKLQPDPQNDANDSNSEEAGAGSDQQGRAIPRKTLPRRTKSLGTKKISTKALGADPKDIVSSSFFGSSSKQVPPKAEPRRRKGLARADSLPGKKLMETPRFDWKKHAEGAGALD